MESHGFKATFGFYEVDMTSKYKIGDYYSCIYLNW